MKDYFTKDYDKTISDNTIADITNANDKNQVVTKENNLKALLVIIKSDGNVVSADDTIATYTKTISALTTSYDKQIAAIDEKARLAAEAATAAAKAAAQAKIDAQAKADAAAKASTNTNANASTTTPSSSSSSGGGHKTAFDYTALANLYDQKAEAEQVHVDFATKVIVHSILF